MDEEITIINEKTRNEKIRGFFKENKKLIVSLITLLILTVLFFYSYQIYKDKQKGLLSDKYNSAVIDFKNGERTRIIVSMKEVIEEKDNTYSPLALYFLIDKNLIENPDEINELFDILIDKTSLETEIKNLIIYKKALYNADSSSERELLDFLNPLINSESIWRSHALYLAAEYFYSKNEKKKSIEFFKKILETKNANQDILKKTQKRLYRDLSE
jgi:hypothetical protein